jgi:hypothetical protein
VERSEYVFTFARKLKIDDGQLLAEVKRAAQQKRPQLPDSAAGPLTAMKFAEKRLLQLLLSRTELQAQVLPFCSKEDFEDLPTARIFGLILEGFGLGKAATFDSLHLQLGGLEEQSLLARLQMEEVPESFSCETAESFLNALRALRLESQKQQILSRIAQAAEQNDEQTLNQLIEQRVLVDRELLSLSRK